MTRSFFCLLLVGAATTATTSLAAADDTKEEAIVEDRKQIEGEWKVVSLVVNGNEAAGEDIEQLTVVNNADGTWSLRKDGEEISKGTSSIDPTTTPSTIDFTVTEGEGRGNKHLGIYELGEQTRKMCFAPAEHERPTELVSTPGSKHVCVKFERQKTDR